MHYSPFVRALLRSVNKWSLKRSTAALFLLMRGKSLKDQLNECPDLELVAVGPLTAVCFRFVPEALRGDEMALNALNQTIMEQLQVAGKAFLAGVDINGQFALRSCALHYALTEREREILHLFPLTDRHASRTLSPLWRAVAIPQDLLNRST
jgi:glutamate/tyrosine decarboxylase-like PLP-dependent enzyme